jgi:hypothetical protein
VSNTTATTEVAMYDVQLSISQELGEGTTLASFITPEKIAACNAIVQQATDDFFSEALSDLERLETLSDQPSSPACMEQLRSSIYTIKSFAKVLGFTLITETCVHCLAAIDNEKLTDKKKRALLAELVKILRVAFDHRIRDDGGAMGNAMLMSLRTLR